jgi:methylmalonyl-CoA/ethylmalonyl-CoA epimerase
MKILRISHLGIAPKNSDDAQAFFLNTIKLHHSGNERVEDQKVDVSFFDCENSRIELLKPTDSTSVIAKFINNKGGGIHHIAFQVDNLEEWIKYLTDKNIAMIDDKPRLGAHHTKIAFIHPKATGGILVELVEESK